MKISFKALTNILLEAGHSFVTELVKNEFPDRKLYRLVVAHSYPITGPHASLGTQEERSLVMRDRESFHRGRIVLHFDPATDTILSCCSAFHKLIMNARDAAVRKVYESEPTPKPGEIIIKTDDLITAS